MTNVFALRRYLRLLVLAMTVMTASSPAHSESGRVWATAVSKNASNGRAIIFRYIKNFQTEFHRSDYPDRVILVWKYRSDSGMPSQAERQSMDRLEDLLSPVLEGPVLAALVLVSTGENRREWIYYAKSEQAFMAVLNKALTTQSRFPIEIHAAPDPAWTTYEDFRKGVRE